MEVTLKFGTTRRRLLFPDHVDVTMLAPARIRPVDDFQDALKHALSSPIGCPRFEERTAPSTVAVAIPDETRNAPFRHMLSVTLDRLYSAYDRLRPEDVTIVIGGGLHPPMDEPSARRWVPTEMAGDCKLVTHDAKKSPMTDFGVTSRGTPVAINTHFARADLKIVLGQIDPHQFVGFTGGSKGATVGCASACTIEHNHSLMFHDSATVGRLADNAVREDLNESGRMIGVDVAVNVVLDPDGAVVNVWAGAPEKVLETGAILCRRVWGVPLAEEFPMAVVSCGGYPKDISLYQAQKGLNLGSHAVVPGGRILLLAACDHGVGDDVYWEYVRRFDSPEAALNDFRTRRFKMGAHKSFLFARTLLSHQVVVDSNLSKKKLRSCMLTPGDAQQELDNWIANYAGKPQVAVIPNGNTTFFFPDPKGIGRKERFNVCAQVATV